MAASKPAAAASDAAAPDPPAAVAPSEAPAQAAPAPAAAPAPPRPPGVYEYVGEIPHTFLPQGFPPQTAALGDVCELAWSPGDDPRWQTTGKPVTRWPDNDPRSGAPDVHDGTNMARTEAEREEILARLGVDPSKVKES